MINIYDFDLNSIIRRDNPGKHEIYAKVKKSDNSKFTISIRGMDIKKIPNEIFKLPNIYHIEISDTQITKIPDSIGDLKTLKIFDLYYSKLTELPISITTINLKLIKLSSNKLKVLPNSIGDLKNLTELELDNNELKTLPDSIGNLTNLVSLDLKNNKLKTLPDSIGNLTKLETLYLDNNQLKTLPDSIGNLDIYIHLSNNPIEKLPKSLLKFLPKDNKGRYIEWKNYEISDTLLKSVLAKTINSGQMKNLPDNIKRKILNNAMQVSKKNKKHIINDKLYPLTDNQLKGIQARTINNNEQMKELPGNIKRKILSNSMQLFKTNNNYVYFGLTQKGKTKNTNNKF